MHSPAGDYRINEKRDALLKEVETWLSHRRSNSGSGLIFEEKDEISALGRSIDPEVQHSVKTAELAPSEQQPVLLIEAETDAGKLTFDELEANYKR